MARTLVSFHAHPDDEALLCAGTLALAAAAGHRVVLVVATSGEVGEADRSSLCAGESLADRRQTETLASAAALGVARTEFLGYGDSGLDGASPAPGTVAFASVSVDEAAARLAAILTDEAADVLTSYDPNGGYGHPDHLHVHAVARRAAELAGTLVVLESTINRDVLRMGLDLVTNLGHELPDDWSSDHVDGWFAEPGEITHVIDVSTQLAAKRAAMSAHASQTTSDSPSSARTLTQFLALPEPFYAMAFGTEWFVARGVAVDQPLTDVFAPLPGAVGG